MGRNGERKSLGKKERSLKETMFKDDWGNLPNNQNKQERNALIWLCVFKDDFDYVDLWWWGPMDDATWQVLRRPRVGIKSETDTGCLRRS